MQSVSFPLKVKFLDETLITVCYHLDYSDHEDEESLLLGDDGGDMDDKFEGAFNNYVATGRDHLTAMVAEARMGTTFQGVEPMGESYAWCQSSAILCNSQDSKWCTE